MAIWNKVKHSQWHVRRQRHAKLTQLTATNPSDEGTSEEKSDEESEEDSPRRARGGLKKLAKAVSTITSVAGAIR
jgi:hypothetical protein